MASIYDIAVEAAQKNVDALMSAQERLSSALAEAKQRWSILRSKLIASLIDGVELKDGRAQVAGLANDYHLLNDTLQKLSVFDLPDSEVELEKAKINRDKASADVALAKANDDISKMASLVSEIPGIKLDISATDASAARIAAAHSQQLAADAAKRLTERRVSIDADKQALLASGFLQRPR